MKTERPIFSIIEENIVDGRLPASFALPDDDGSSGGSKLKMAPGAMDGICIYHMPHETLSDDGKEAIAAAVQAAESGAENAYELFENLGEKYRAISIIDEVQGYIREHAGEIDQGELLMFAINRLIFGGTDIECVKFGLIITELYGEFDEEIKWVFRTIGLYDEFTIFAVFNMLTWENGNEEIFELVKQVDSWGKIHAVERLKPETQEIRDWILYEGMDNGVMPEYLALTCMLKSGAAERLKKHPTKEEFSAVSHILRCLFNEGPVCGISGLPEAEETLEDYLLCAEQQKPDIEDYEAVLEIRNYAREGGQYLSLEQHADCILHSDPCYTCVEETVKTGEGVSLAEELEIPYKDALLRYMKRDFGKAFHWCSLLMKDPAYVDTVLELYRSEIPPERIEQNPGDEQEFGKGNEAYQQVNFLLQELPDYPGKGMDYLKKTISAPVKRSRFLTIKILKAWVARAGKPLAECYPEMFEHLSGACAAEISDELKTEIRRLLDGETEFSE